MRRRRREEKEKERKEKEGGRRNRRGAVPHLINAPLLLRDEVFLGEVRGDEVELLVSLEVRELARRENPRVPSRWW